MNLSEIFWNSKAFCVILPVYSIVYTTYIVEHLKIRSDRRYFVIN